MIRTFSLANAVTSLVAVSYVVCYALALIVPGFLFTIAQSWIHVLNLDTLQTSATLSLGEAIIGLVSVSAVVWVWTYATAAVYNRLASRAEVEETAIAHSIAAVHHAR